MYELSEYLAKIAKKADAPLQAVIRESDCIGCMKCVHSCPVDAIVGAAKQMHTVIAVECTGCELCVEPCPVDCIDMIALPKSTYELARVRRRFEAHTKRLAEKSAKKLPEKESIAERKAYIAAALVRVKTKRAGAIC